MKTRFEEIGPSDFKKTNAALRDAINNSPEEDREDGLDLLELIEDRHWWGKLEYPVPQDTVKTATSIKRGVFHSMAIYIHKGKWRFTRTEFNKNVDFGRKKTDEGN